MPWDLFLMGQHSWILDYESRVALPRKTGDGSSVLTCHLQIHNGLFIDVTIFKETVVLPLIKNTDTVDSESHFALSQGIIQEHCTIYIVLKAFSREFSSILVHINQLGVVIKIPADIHVFCTLWWGQLATEISTFTYCDHLVASGTAHSELCGGSWRPRI